MHDTDRDDWCRQRQPSRLSAVFQPGQPMRCPSSRISASGRRLTCGYIIGDAPLDVREAVVRGPLGLPPIKGSEHQIRSCPSCHKTLDVFLIRAVRLEATG